MNDNKERFKELYSNRIVILLFGIIVLFGIVVFKLVDLQIIHGQEYAKSVTASVSKTVSITAQRGNIYDRYGRPLALNNISYSVDLDNSIASDFADNKYNLLVALADNIWKDKSIPFDDLPFSVNGENEYEYNFIRNLDKEYNQYKIEKYGIDDPYFRLGEELLENQTENNIDNEIIKATDKQISDWQKSVNIPKEIRGGSAGEVLEYLYEIYNVPDYYKEEEKRAFLSFILSMSDNNILAITLAQKFKIFNEELVADLPMGNEYPYYFTFTNINREIEFKQSVGMKNEQLEYNEIQTLEYMAEFFGLPKGLPYDTMRDAVAIRYTIYSLSYQQYKSSSLATEINDKTLAYFEENQDIFVNISINPVSLRNYPEGQYFSHLIGYVREMTAEDYSLYENEVDINGNKIYTQNDIVGQSGFEKLYERDLNGVDGKLFIEVNNRGRRISVIDETQPIAGKDIFLTLDAKLQRIAYDTLEQELAYAIINKLTSTNSNTRIEIKDLFIGMADYNYISAIKMMDINNSEDTVQYKVYSRFLEDNPQYTIGYNYEEFINNDILLENFNYEEFFNQDFFKDSFIYENFSEIDFENIDFENIDFDIFDYEEFIETYFDFEDVDIALQKYLLEGIENGSISEIECVYLVLEQGVINIDELVEEEVILLENGLLDSKTFILNRLIDGNLKPAKTGLDPSSGSVFVTKVDSGEVLASVTYPSYDNNELVNKFNNQYYTDLLQDKNTPLVNRPLKQKKAPGSTFKMIPLLAGLETNVITPTTTIQDRGLFTDAGVPHARCWAYNNGYTHGSINASQALEVSCNYFLYTVAYNMGNSYNGGTIKSITTLNEYMTFFGLNGTTGVEIQETAPTIASPYNKAVIMRNSDPNATDSQVKWTDGDNIRTAIGQSYNSFTPAQMTRYVSTLANGGTLYELYMVDSLKHSDGLLYKEYSGNITNVADFSQTNLDAIYNGMLRVTTGSSGTLRNYFNDYPINVAAKTGTAQEDLNRSSHSWLVGFAPYENPQIAITVMIPFGDGSNFIAPAVTKAVINEYLGLDVEEVNYNLETIINRM